MPADDPYRDRAPLALAVLGLLLSATGAVLLARPYAFALALLPAVALLLVLRRSRAV